MDHFSSNRLDAWRTSSEFALSSHQNTSLSFIKTSVQFVKPLFSPY